MTAFSTLNEWNLKLKDGFPKRLVGELPLSEATFRELLRVLQQFGQTTSLVTPPVLFPRLILTVMTFTARYDYDGGFWPAFCDNLHLDSIDRTAWGNAFRKALRSLNLFTPPEHRMVNVFPVLFHSIVPERSLEDFAMMCRALYDSVDVRMLDDYELGAAIDSADLPKTLRRFVAGGESREVALELVRHVAEDNRLGVDASQDTLRGRILGMARAATESTSYAYRMKIQPLPWRYDFNTGRFGLWLASARRFENRPTSLRLGQLEVETHAQAVSGSWMLMPQLISVPLATESTEGALESYGEALLHVRVGRPPQRVPLIFRSLGDAGIYDSSEYGATGDYAIADNGCSVVVDANGQPIEALEELPTLIVPGISQSRLFSLEEGSRVLADGHSVFEAHAATRPSVELRGRTSWQLVDARGTVRVVSAPPTLHIQSPFADSEFMLFTGSSSKPSARIAFAGRLSVRPEVDTGEVYRTSVWVDGHPSGAAGSEFIVLPIYTTLISSGDDQTMCFTGEGNLTIGLQTLSLHATDHAALALGEFLNHDEACYELGGRTFRLRYSGARPLAWGFDRKTLRHTVLSLRADQLDCDIALTVTGDAGSTATLSIDGKIFRTEHFDANGFARFPLIDAVPLALSRGWVSIVLNAHGESLEAVTMFGVPQVQHEELTWRTGIVVGRICLDHAVDSLELRAQPFHAPWLPAETHTCEGLGHLWEVEASFINRRCCLSLVAQVDGVAVAIMNGIGPWEKECGAAVDSRSSLDVALYDVLNGDSDDAAIGYNSQERIEIVRRCLTMLESNARRKERPNIEATFRALSRTFRVCDIDILDDLLQATSSHVKQIAAFCGLPVAAFHQKDESLTVSPHAGQEPAVLAQFIRFDTAVRTTDNETSLAPIIESFELSHDPLVCAYARLLRRLRMCSAETMERLSNMFEGRLIAGALLEVDVSSYLERWVGHESGAPSFFSVVAQRIWGLAAVSRRARRLDPKLQLPLAVSIASSLMDSDVVGELLRLALARVELDLSSVSVGLPA